MAERDPRPDGDEAPLPEWRIWLQCFQATIPPSSETESRSPRPWSAGRLQLPVRPRPFASSFRGSSPTSAPDRKSSITERAGRENGRCGASTVLSLRNKDRVNTPKIPAGRICSTETPVVAALVVLVEALRSVI